MRLMIVRTKTLSSGPHSFPLVYIEELGGPEDKGSQDVTHIHGSQKKNLNLIELGYFTNLKHSLPLPAEEQ